MAYVGIDGEDMYYEMEGDGDAIVLIHGNEAHHRTWEHQFEGS
ncbi:hypothetical protein QA600_22705 [Natronococcus sp. A-GB1]|nr:hypothetical protein [Natronococcus sp. A-GB1]MDG5762128.1 hypothetical protein [Natronococcus sp. A-GB1]